MGPYSSDKFAAGSSVRVMRAELTSDSPSDDRWSQRFSSAAKTALSLALTLLLMVLHSPAQSTSGNIGGTIYDPSGAAIGSASVAARNDDTGAQAEAVTSPKGQFLFSNLPVGIYTLSVSSPGFSASKLAGVRVELNQTVTANVTLTVETASTRIEVSEAPPAIDTTSAQVSTTFEAKQMSDLAVTSGTSGIINLSLLTAGVGSSGGVGYGNGPTVGGQRPTNNNFTVEGIDNNNKSTTGPLVTVPNDAVSEFSILQNQFSADFGHSSGGQFNQVVKSGTNEFHGSVYEYFANRNLNSADNLDSVEGNPLHPRFDNNRFGGTIGGPIKRNKMFFFANWEYNPVGQTSSIQYQIPTANGYKTLSAIPGINLTNLAELTKYLGTAATPTKAANLPFGSDILVGPGNAALGTQTNAVPVEVGAVSSSPANYANADNGVASFDYVVSDRDSVRVRYIFNRLGPVDLNGFPSVFVGVTPANTYIVTASEYHTFTPSMTNEFRLGYNRYFNDLPSVGNQKFPGLDSFPNITIYELNVGLGPDPNAPQFAIQNTYQLTNNLSWTKGNHSLKFGFDGWKSISPSSFTQRSRGDYQWSFFSDYLFDNNPDVIAQRGIGNVVYYGDQFLLSGYASDIWKVRPNLAVNLGLRYEYQTIPYTQRLQDLNSLASVPGLISFNTPKAQTKNFMPRIGIAYSPGTSGRTSIRAGFGINYDIIYDNLGSITLPPQLNTTVDVTGLDKSGFLANGGILPSSGSAPTTPAGARFLTSGFIPDQKRPQSIQWNFGFQHAVKQGFTVEVRYLGNRGLFLPVQLQLNRQPVVNASNALPVYYAQPSQASLDSLTSTLAALSSSFQNGGFIVPAFASAGFNNPASSMTAYMPVGNSTYHGLATQVNRRLAHGLQFVGAYTYSHAIDDSTATVASTVFTPRRPENSQDLRVERASSALDHRQRLTFEMLYDLPFFKHRNWWMKNVLGNWEIAPIYIYQTGTLITPQSEIDANLNADSAPDRVFVNPAGTRNVGSSLSPLTNSSGDTVAYLVDNPQAMYIQAARGTLPTAGRNLLHLNPIDDLDLTVAKRFSISERFNLEFAVRAFNALNHPQYVGGFLDDALFTNFGPGTNAGVIAQNSFNPASTTFGKWDQAFSSNSRSLQLTLKLSF